LFIFGLVYIKAVLGSDVKAGAEFEDVKLTTGIRVV
jgi:hypothetical protein